MSDRLLLETTQYMWVVCFELAKTLFSAFSHKKSYNMKILHWFTAANFIQFLSMVFTLDHDLNCAVCRAIVDEVNYSISKVDPKQTIQVGSFRVDSKGNQDTYKKPYARSEVHLMELFEGVCENFRDYAETTNDAGKRSVCRTKARDGKALALKDIKINADIQKALKHKCETLIEEHEDDMIALFRKDAPSIEAAVCEELTGQCTGEQLKIPMPVSEFDGMDAIVDDVEKDRAAVKEDTADEDQELMDQYLRDNPNTDFSVPADKVTELNADKNNEKTEL